MQLSERHRNKEVNQWSSWITLKLIS